jgi:predicted flap endonuclease-1-like 5' DNA nuclease
MPELTALHIVLLAALVVAGVAVGWFARDRRAAREKAALDRGLVAELDAHRLERHRLAARSRELAAEASRYEAAYRNATNRSKELASALKEAFARRDRLQGQVKDVLANLEGALAERRRLESDVRKFATEDGSRAAALREKDEKIFRLSRELDSWQDRLPPLVKRFKDRDDNARRLESALDRANERILELEAGRAAGHTHVESVRQDVLAEEMDASNDALARTGSIHVPAAAAFAGLGFEEATARLDGANPASSIGNVEPTRDDLKAIKGIGPAIEKLLHELGIFRYSQIAEISEYDIDRIAERLKGFRTRIHREDWIGQARELKFRRRTH